MINRIHITSFVGLTILIWLLALWAQGMPVLTLDFLKPFSLVVGLIVAVSLAFNYWIWRWRVLHGWYVKVPYIGGTWKVTLQSDWIDPETNQVIVPIECFLSVRQTLTFLTARLITKESTSHSIAYSIHCEQDGIYRLNVIYRNEPRVELQGVRSEIHHGSFKLEVLGDDHSRMAGHYWTDRKTRGSMECLRATREVCPDWQSAQDSIEQGAQPDACGAG